MFPAVFASFDPPDVPRLRPSVYWTFIARPLAERLFSDSIIALYSSWPPLVLKSTSAYGFCTRVTWPAALRSTSENSRMTNAAVAGFGLVTTSTIWLPTLRRNRLRPWLPT